MEFGWMLVGPRDQNWECVTQSHEKTTHPSDVVFRYSNPYSEGDLNTYVTTDLKSYASGTLTRTSLRNAIKNLLISTECANVSQSFQDHYIEPSSNSEVVGLLFVYNHDSNYDKSFRSTLVHAMEDVTHQLRRGRRVFVMGPEDVLYAHDLATDMKMQRADNHYPSQREELEFFYPDLVRRKANHSENKAASLEMLLSPYQIIRYKMPSESGTITNYTVYYRGDGADHREFVYLIDGLFRYQILQHAHEVTLCLGRPHNDAASKFERAKEAYVQQFHGLTEMRNRLNIVKYRALTNIAPRFSATEIGMEAR
jgi:hypothetical protein